MKLFIDCEFNGFGGDLISMAIVPEGTEPWFYCAVFNNDAPMDPWVVKNVLPVLRADRTTYGMFRVLLHDYLMQYEEPEFIADWPADIGYLLQAFMGEDHSETLSYPCSMRIIPDLEYKSGVPHNALADAIALARAYQERYGIDK